MSRGLQRERDLVSLLRKDGYWAIRSPASKGDVDVVAIKRSPYCYRTKTAAVQVRFIEVKSTLTPYSHFGPTARRDILDAANRVGASAELAWWPKNGKLVFIPSSEWPPH